VGKGFGANYDVKVPCVVPFEHWSHWTLDRWCSSPLL